MRRTKKEIATALVDFLNKQEKPFFKTDLEEIGLNSKTAEHWLEVYKIMKTGPNIRQIELKKTILFEVIREKK